MSKGEWTFITNHGRVFTYIAKYPRSITQEIAQEVGVTLRTVQKIIDDLEAAGYITRYKEGRRNQYIIHPELPMRHRLEQEHIVSGMLQALGYNPHINNTTSKN